MAVGRRGHLFFESEVGRTSSSERKQRRGMDASFPILQDESRKGRSERPRGAMQAGVHPRSRPMAIDVVVSHLQARSKQTWSVASLVRVDAPTELSNVSFFVGKDGRGCRDANPARTDLRFDRRHSKFTRVCEKTTTRTHVDDGGRVACDRGRVPPLERMERMRMEAMDTRGKTTCTSHETKDGKEVPVAFARGFRPCTSIRRTMGQTTSYFFTEHDASLSFVARAHACRSTRPSDPRATHPRPPRRRPYPFESNRTPLRGISVSVVEIHRCGEYPVRPKGYQWMGWKPIETGRETVRRMA